MKGTDLILPTANMSPQQVARLMEDIAKFRLRDRSKLARVGLKK